MLHMITAGRALISHISRQPDITAVENSNKSRNCLCSLVSLQMFARSILFRRPKEREKGGADGKGFRARSPQFAPYPRTCVMSATNH